MTGLSHVLFHSFIIYLHTFKWNTAFSKDISHQAHSREKAETEPTPSSMGPSQGRQHGQVQFQETSLAPYQAWIVTTFVIMF